MMDAKSLRDDAIHFAPDDALVVVYIPREGVDRPRRRMHFYQLNLPEVWQGVSDGLPLPDYVPADDPPLEPLPPPPPPEDECAITTDVLNVREQPGTDKAKRPTPLVQGTMVYIQGNVATTGKGNSFHWGQITRCPSLKSAVGGWVAREFLKQPCPGGG